MLKVKSEQKIVLNTCKQFNLMPRYVFLQTKFEVFFKSTDFGKNLKFPTNHKLREKNVMSMQGGRPFRLCWSKYCAISF